MVWKRKKIGNDAHSIYFSHSLSTARLLLSCFIFFFFVFIWSFLCIFAKHTHTHFISPKIQFISFYCISFFSLVSSSSFCGPFYNVFFCSHFYFYLLEYLLLDLSWYFFLKYLYFFLSFFLTSIEIFFTFQLSEWLFERQATASSTESGKNKICFPPPRKDKKETNLLADRYCLYAYYLYWKRALFWHTHSF